MQTRKSLKQQAKLNLKKHYLIFAALCLIAGFIGSEFNSSLTIISSTNSEAAPSDVSSETVIGPKLGMGDVIADILSGNLEEGSHCLLYTSGIQQLCAGTFQQFSHTMGIGCNAAHPLKVI